MSAEQLLLELRQLDVRLGVEDGRLRCSAPKGRLSRELQERIALHKTELIRTLSSARQVDLSIPRRSSAHAGLPLSFAQERFWFLQNLEPESTAYNITSVHYPPGQVDETILQTALSSVAYRHEILRTTFPEVDGVPTQVIAARPMVTVTTHDCSASADKKAATDAIVQQVAQHRFDLGRGPLLRVDLIRRAADDYAVVVVMHHIICDAWSIGLLYRELRAAYETQVGMRAVESPLPIQYADYALWERARQKSNIISQQLDYWRKKLKGAPRQLDLPMDHARPERQIPACELYGFELDGPVSDALKRLARQEGASSFMALLSIFKALLARYTGQNDIVVGTPVSTRALPELEQLIGCLINTHVLRSQIPAGTTGRKLIGQVRQVVLEAASNSDAPFEKLVSELVNERDLSRSPLFQAAFILQNTPMASDYDVISGGAGLDMTLYMWESNGRIGGSLEFDANLFERETIARFASCFQTLAAGFAANPDTPIHQLPLFSPSQELAWFGPQIGETLAYPEISTHEWIERQAAATPDAVAVVFGSARVTFGELSASSNRLARRLRGLGVSTGSLVAVCLERSIDLVVAPLAVWKAGAAYVPMDPEYPRNRLAHMLKDSAAGVLITNTRLLNRLPRTAADTVCLDRDKKLIEQESSQPLPVAGANDARAYVIYTSGSTGTPKGVAIQHRALVNFLASMQRQPGMNASDRLLAVTSLSFDIAGLELYLPLVSGARTVIAAREAALDGSALADMIREYGITVMQATPVTWRMLLASGWSGPPGFKILCGGEAMSRDLATQLLATGAEVWNLYGPTETTIWSTIQRVAPGEGRVPIGHPIANTQVYVMDTALRRMPPGAVGELYIGGDGLAKGYLHPTAAQAERFVAAAPGGYGTLYRTGDLARSLHDGSLECLARIDHQIKLRGYRIEPGEIEAVLAQQPGFTEAVVVLRDDGPAGKRLVAYLKVQQDLAIDPTHLRRALLETLPEYMVPAAFVRIDRFPLTPNQKVDRQALLAEEYHPRHFDSFMDAKSRAASATPMMTDDEARQNDQPANHVEMVMAEIWREILAVDRVGISDNFFSLGGHSLTAVQLIARLRTALGVDLPLRCIFIDPTIARLARHIFFDAATRTYRYTSELPRWNCLIPVQPKGTRPPLFFVAGYQNADDTLLILSQLIPHFGLDQPIFGFRPRWIENNEHEYHSVQEITEEFAAELRAVQPKGPYFLGGHCVGGIAAAEVARLLMQQGEEVRLMAFIDTERPTKARALRTDVFFFRLRASHMLEVVSEILRPKRQSRAQLIGNLVRRKFGIATSPEVREADRFQQSKVRYRRLLYSHWMDSYPGRITLIVNAEQARFDKDLGWSEIPHGGLDVHTIPGTHDTILVERGKEIVDVIRKTIDESLNGREGQSELTEAGVS